MFLGVFFVSYGYIRGEFCIHFKAETSNIHGESWDLELVPFPQKTPSFC